MKVFVSANAASLALGSRRVAALLAEEASRRELVLDIVSTGSRGLFWLEPLVEVEAPDGRIAYGPLGPSAVAGLFNAGFKAGKDHPLRLGRLEDQPYLAQRTRLTFACCGIVDPLSLTDYRAHSGYAGLERTLSLVS